VSSDADRDPWVGRLIEGRYRVLSPLGLGGMGSVYEAEHVALAKRVALKVIHPALVRDEEARARFEREARATASIEHPHVAAGMDFGRLPDGGAFLVVQLVAGQPLRERFEAGPVPWRDACTIGAQIADALSAIHARGFVHRDLTADNVLVTTKDGSLHARVLDLGVAGLVGEHPDQKLTAEGHIVGTPGYMPPEQALGKPTGPRADLYALGVLLWEMCSGKSLYGARELTQVLAMQLTDEPPKIAQLSSATAPHGLAQLIERLLAREPDDRPADAIVVRDALRRFAKMSNVTPVIHRFGVPAISVVAIGAFAVVASLATLALVVFLIFGVSDDEETPERARPEVAAEPTEVEVVEPPPAPAVAPEIEAAIDEMIDSRWRDRRRAAAITVRDTAGLPAWTTAVADLELARTCGERQLALAQIVDHPNERALPAIARLRDVRTGCGRGRRGDCYACVRADIERAYEAAGGT
jgi:tRNA A-37 threonylcarbamoyl transferase component Bud32